MIGEDNTERVTKADGIVVSLQLVVAIENLFDVLDVSSRRLRPQRGLQIGRASGCVAREAASRRLIGGLAKRCVDARLNRTNAGTRQIVHLRSYPTDRHVRGRDVAKRGIGEHLPDRAAGDRTVERIPHWTAIRVIGISCAAEAE
jgi:hypothetical protein